MRILLLIFIGGGLGSLMRYLISRWITGAVVSAFPYGTFIVNIIGCFLIGFIMFYTERFGSQSIQWRLFLVTGLCGGFTTFSSFSFENVQLINDHRIFVFLLYTICSVTLGIFATYFGIVVARNV
jgi:fluoride exporter